MICTANDTITYAITCTFVGADGGVVAPYPISFAAICSVEILTKCLSTRYIFSVLGYLFIAITPPLNLGIIIINNQSYAYISCSISSVSLQHMILIIKHKEAYDKRHRLVEPPMPTIKMI